jgi:glutamyl-tRNA(Gln) amidotransferase subunit E
MEFKTRKEIVYQLERSSVCTYEMDDTPPFEIDGAAVRGALLQSRLLNLNLVGELHVMRKQYLDGSIPTGFQRTAMVGLGGEIPFSESELGSDRSIRIRQLSLEEDSCREVSDVGHRIVFRTDRLGMPLTEAVTEPDLLTPTDVRRGGELLARVAHATGIARRGPGAARQDVNVSIAGGRRVEIKGVWSHGILPLLVHTESYRQLNLLRMRARLLGRGVEKAMLTIPDHGLPWEESTLCVDATAILKKADFAPVRQAVEAGQTVAAIRLPGFGGLMAQRTQPGMNFASELAGRLRVIACLTGRPFMIDSSVEYGLLGSEWAQLRKSLSAGSRSEDAVIVLWGDVLDVATGCREVLLRGIDALEGVPAETRQAFADGTTGFERILPGVDRMYPDTDTPPLRVDEDWVRSIDENLPERPWQRHARYLTLGLETAAAWRLVTAPWADLFDTLSPTSQEAANRLAWGLEKCLVGHLRQGGAVPGAVQVAPLVRMLEAGGPKRHAFEELLRALLRDPDFDVEATLEMLDEPVDLREALTQIRSRVLDLRSDDPVAATRWGMGQVMRGLLGRIEPTEVGARVSEIFTEEVAAA